MASACNNFVQPLVMWNGSSGFNNKLWFGFILKGIYCKLFTILCDYNLIIGANPQLTGTVFKNIQVPSFELS